MWCQIAHQYQQNKSDKAAAIKKNQTDRLAYTLNKFGGWVGFALGNAKSTIKQAQAADDQGAPGANAQESGQEVVGRSPRRSASIFAQFRRYMVRKIGALVAEVEKRLTKWTTSKGWSCTESSKILIQATELHLPGCPTEPKATTKPRAPDEIAADPAPNRSRSRRSAPFCGSA